MKNILYLTWCENIVDYGIFESQVFRKLVYLNKSDKYKYFILSGIPIGKKYLSNAGTYRDKIANIRSRFFVENILFYHRNVLKISQHYHAQWWALWLLHLPHVLFLRNFIKNQRIDLVHCRSYHAALLGLLTRKIFRMNYKVVFDTRGLVPEEGILIGAYKEESLSYRLWKFVEKRLFDEADAIVNVSDTFSEHVREISDNGNIHTIYTGVDTRIFLKDPGKRTEVNGILGIGESARVLVYSGSLGEKGWHSPDLLADVYASFKKCFTESKLLIVSRSDSRVISERLEARGLNRNDYVIVPAHSLQEVSFYLQRGDYAAFPYREISGRIEETVSRSVIAIKTGEYLACGLPLIVNSNVGAASALVEKYGIGVAFKPDTLADIIDGIRLIDGNYNQVAEKCRAVASDYFDYEKNTRKYLSLYDTLLV